MGSDNLNSGHFGYTHMTECLFKLMKKDCRIRSQVDYEFDHFSEIDDEMETIKDLFIIYAFATFERLRLLRKRVLDSLGSQKNELSADLVQDVRNESEFIKIETFLDVLKNFVDSNRIGLIKQIKRYREWAAHGKSNNCKFCF